MKKILISSLILSTFSIKLYGQAPPPAQDTVYRPSQQQQSPHGEDIPIFDFTNKSFEFQGKTYGMSDNNLGGQFEAYLASDTLSSDKAKVYRKQIRQILDYIAPNKTDGSKLKPAYDLLSEASQYEGDGYICESLANAIYSAQLTISGKKKKEKEIVKLKEEKRRILRNLGVSTSKGNLEEPGTKEENQAKALQSVDALNMQKTILEIEAKIKKLEAEIELRIINSKLHFQSMIVQLFVQRRFEHVIMGTRFYNLVYLDGDNELTLKKGSDTFKLFSEGIGVEPTVAGLDAAASEAIRKVNTLVSAFRNDLNTGKVHSASNRIMEAFIIGEFLPLVQTVPKGSKVPIQQYIQDAHDMIKVIEANDLNRAAELNESLKRQANDYNASEATSYIAAKKAESRFNVRDAKIAYGFMLKAENSSDYYNQHTRLNEAMENATKAWPSNPELKEFITIIDNSIIRQRDGGNMLLTARKDFDRFVDTQAHTSIMKKENLAKFIASFSLSDAPEDRDRAKLLDKITEQTTSIFATIKEAETYYSRGHAPAAWELIDIAIQQYPNNLELSKAKALYSSKAATFSNTISKAKDFEQKSPISARALTWYLKAEAIYPDSQYANEGISRIIDNKFNSSQPSSKVTMN